MHGLKDHLDLKTDGPVRQAPNEGAHPAMACLKMLLILLCVQGVATSQGVAALQSSTEEIVNGLKGMVSTVTICDAETGQILASHRPERMLIPASNQKAITGAAAWLGSGPDHTLVTDMLTHGVVTNGVLHGSVRLRGEFDPTLSRSWSLAALSKKLKEAGIERIRGDILYDDLVANGQRSGPQWPKDDPTRRYMAEVGTLSLDHGLVEVVVANAGGGDSGPTAAVFPQGCGWSVENRLKSCDAQKDHVVHIRRQDKKRTLVVEGKVLAGTSGQSLEISIHDVASVFAQALRKQLELDGIRVDGEVRSLGRAQLQGRGRLIARFETPVVDVLKVLLKASQNHRAEMLAHHLCLTQGLDPSFANGGRAIERIFKKNGIDVGDCVLMDGSGLSYGNRISSQFLSQVLLAVWKHDRAQEFLDCLPHGGQAGSTLSRRLKDVGKNVRAKTGTLAKAIGLSGFAKTKDDRWVVFSMIVNAGRGMSQGLARRGCDKLVRTIGATRIGS